MSFSKMSFSKLKSNHTIRRNAMSLVHGYLDDMNECATETITESTVAESGNLEPSEPPDNDYENREKLPSANYLSTMGIGARFWWSNTFPHTNKFGLRKRNFNLETGCRVFCRHNLHFPILYVTCHDHHHLFLKRPFFHA
jgi:hypothetical protein